MNAGRTARERARAEVTREITEIGRRQLGTEGATGLNLRAIARELGMVSSAVYRYFPSRDDLLTALIVDGYNAIGEAVEQADAGCPPDDHAARWMAVCHAVRDWALAHPHEYALLYGSPVPGYQAPADTLAPAVRDTVAYGRILTDAHQAGMLEPPDGFPAPPPSFSRDADTVRQILSDLPDDLVARAITAWTGLFGFVSFEVFGQFTNIVDDRTALFDHVVRTLGRLTGLPTGG